MAGRLSVHGATADVLYKFQGQKVSDQGQGHQAAQGGCSSHRLQRRGAGTYCGGRTQHSLLLVCFFLLETGDQT